MRHYRLPVIVSGVMLLLITVVGLAATPWIKQTGGDTKERVEMLGGGLAILFGITITPFWFYAAIEAGKERRAALNARNPKSKGVGTRRKK